MKVFFNQIIEKYSTDGFHSCEYICSLKSSDRIQKQEWFKPIESDDVFKIIKRLHDVFGSNAEISWRESNKGSSSVKLVLSSQEDIDYFNILNNNGMDI